MVRARFAADKERLPAAGYSVVLSLGEAAEIEGLAGAGCAVNRSVGVAAATDKAAALTTVASRSVGVRPERESAPAAFRSVLTRLAATAVMVREPAAGAIVTERPDVDVVSLPTKNSHGR